MYKFIAISILEVLLCCNIFFNAHSQTITQGDSAKLLETKWIVGIKEAPPFIIKESDGSYSGLSISLWKQIANKGDIRFEFKEYKNVVSILAATEKGEVDICISPLTVTSERIQIMDFSQPFFISSLGVTTFKKSEVLHYIKNFFSIDFIQTVLILVGVIFFFGFLAWVLERRKNDDFDNGFKGIFDGFWWSAVTMTTVGYGDKATKTPLGRILAMVWMFGAIIMISSLTASITSAITVKSLDSRIDHVSDLKKMKVGTLEGSSSEKYLIHNSVKITTYNFPEEALQAVADKKIDAFVYDKPILQYYIHQGDHQNELQILPKSLSTDYYSFSFPKNSKLESKINPLLVEAINSAEWKRDLEIYTP